MSEISKKVSLETDYSLVREGLVREIGEADRWSTIMDAWKALLHVRHMATFMLSEQERSHSSVFAPVHDPFHVQYIGPFGDELWSIEEEAHARFGGNDGRHPQAAPNKDPVEFAAKLPGTFEPCTSQEFDAVVIDEAGGLTPNDIERIVDGEPEIRCDYRPPWDPISGFGEPPPVPEELAEHVAIAPRDKDAPPWFFAPPGPRSRWLGYWAKRRPWYRRLWARLMAGPFYRWAR